MDEEENFHMLSGVSENRFWDGLLSISGVKRTGNSLLIRGCFLTPDVNFGEGISGFKLVGPSHNKVRALTAIASRFRTEIGGTSGDHGPFIDEDEAHAFMVLDEERVNHWRGEILSYLRGEPHDLADTTHPYVRLAYAVADDDFTLLAEGNEDALFDAIDKRSAARARQAIDRRNENEG